MVGWHYLSDAASFVLRVFRRVKDHHNLPHDSPLLKNTGVRQVVLDKLFPLIGPACPCQCLKKTLLRSRPWTCHAAAEAALQLLIWRTESLPSEGSCSPEECCFCYSYWRHQGLGRQVRFPSGLLIHVCFSSKAPTRNRQACT